MDDVRYIAKVVEQIDNGPGHSKSLKVGVFQVQGNTETQVGMYSRNYHTLFRTFHHLKKNGKDYALYSPHYTVTRVMELPSCTDIGGEEPTATGFCPVDFYVPWHPDQEEDEFSTTEFGFVAGCLWGDDSSWKIEYLDLSEVEKGIIRRDSRFGYLVLPDKCTLEQAISLYSFYPDEPYIAIAVQRYFNIHTGKAVWE